MLYDQEKSSFRYNALTEITRKVVDFDDIKFLDCLINYKKWTFKVVQNTCDELW